jgi:hypothetical protein
MSRLGGRLARRRGLGGGAHASEAVWEAPRAPGSVVVLRRSDAPGAFDPPDARLDDCSTQRKSGQALDAWLDRRA